MINVFSRNTSTAGTELQDYPMQRRSLIVLLTLVMHCFICESHNITFCFIADFYLGFLYRDFQGYFTACAVLFFLSQKKKNIFHSYKAIKEQGQILPLMWSHTYCIKPCSLTKVISTTCVLEACTAYCIAVSFSLMKHHELPL